MAKNISKTQEIVGSKTFRKDTIKKADAVYLSKDEKFIVVHNKWAVYKRDKKGNLLNVTIHNKIKKYPNTKANKNKAESLIGFKPY